MAKFCTKCGKPLNEGEVCSCQAQAAPQQAAPMTSPVAPQAAPQQAAPMTPPVAPQAAPQQAAPMTSPVAPQAAPQQAAPMTPPPVAPQQAPQQAAPVAPQVAPQQATPMTPPPVAPQQGTYQQAAPMTPPTVAPQQATYQQAPQGTPGMIPPPVAPQPGQAPTMTKEAEWFNQTKDALVSNTKNVFAEILPMLKAPKDTAARLGKSESGLVLGIELIAVKAFLALVMFLITFISLSVKLGNMMGEYSDYISLPWFRGILLVIFVTIGADCLNAVLLKVVAGLFNAKITFQGSFAIVGQRVLFDIMVMVVMGIMSLLSTGIAIAIVLIGGLCLIALEYNAYEAAVEGDDNKKTYMYLIAKAAVTVIILLLAYLLVKGMISGALGSVIGSSLNGLGGLGGSSSSIMDYLY